MLSIDHVLMPMLYIPFSGVNDSAHVTVTKMLANLERPSARARVQPKPSNVRNLDAKNHTEKHVSHLNEIPATGFLASIQSFKNK